MLDKVSDKQMPVVGDTDLSTPAEDALAEYIVSTPDEDSPPKRSVAYYLGKLLLAILQAVLMIAILAGAYFVAQKLIADAPEPRKRPAFKTVYTIETVDAKLADHQPVFISYGQTIAARSVELRALVSGEIVSVNDKLRAGAGVAKGEALLEIDGFSYRGALSEAQANLDEARAKVAENRAQIELEESKLAAANEQLGFAEVDYERAASLMQRGSSTQQIVEARKLVVSQRKQAVALSKDTIKVQQSRIAQLQASIARFEWRVKQASRDLSSTTLVAPFAGIVRSSTAEMGRVITANDVVVSLYEADTLEVKFTLTDAQYGRLQTAKAGLIGREVKVVWSVGGTEFNYPATIERIGAEITSNRGGVEVYALVGKSENAITIRPGAFVEVRVPDQVFTATVAVPDTAIYGTNRVYTEVDGRLVENQVTIAAYDGERALVSSGLTAGDKVLITRITEVSAGLLVRREGDQIPQRPGSAGTKDDASKGESRKGRPTPEEISRVAAANKLSVEAFRALPQPKRRQLIRTHRAKAEQ